MLILVAESHIVMVEDAEQNGEKKIVTNICCRFGQHFHWIIIDALNIQTSSAVFCHLPILQLWLFNFSNILVHQRDIVTNSSIKCGALEIVICNGIISSQARAIKIKLKLW